MKPVGVVPFVQDFSDRTQTFVDKYQLAKQRRMKRLLNRPEVVEHEDEISNGEENVKDEDISVEEADVTSDDQFDVLMGITDECHLATPVCD